MRRTFLEVLRVLDGAFELLERQVPPPQPQAWHDGFVFRYAEQTIQQALVLKLARCITGLRSIDVLLLHGLIQEQATMQRVLDEIHEDIAFLAAAITNDRLTERHAQYLDAFFAEEFPEPANPLARHKKPNLPPRRKIREYVNRELAKSPNPSLISDVGETISSLYSGFVHASAPQVLEMYGGDPPHFHVQGMRGTPRIPEYIHDAWNYFLRSLLATTMVAKAFGDKPLVGALYEQIKKFEATDNERPLT